MSAFGVSQASTIPRVHQRDPIAPHGFVHEVGRDEDGHALTPRQIDEQLPELVAGDRVDAGSRFVEDQHVRAVDDGDGQREPLAHAQGKLLGQVVDVLQPEAVNQLVDSLAGLDSGGRL